MRRVGNDGSYVETFRIRVKPRSRENGTGASGRGDAVTADPGVGRLTARAGRRPVLRGVCGSAAGKRRAALTDPARETGARPAGAWRRKRGASRTGTRCKSLGVGARRKPSRWESNHEDGTSGSGGTDRPKGGATPREWTRAGEVGRGTQRTNGRGGSAAAGGFQAGIHLDHQSSRLVARSDARRDPADSPGAAQVATGPAVTARMRGSASARRFRHLRGEEPRRRGGARERGPTGGCGLRGVAPCAHRCKSARGRPRRASASRDRARTYEGQSRPRSSRGPSRGDTG